MLSGSALVKASRKHVGEIDPWLLPDFDSWWCTASSLVWYGPGDEALRDEILTENEYKMVF
jgi:hypothetical protein